MTIDEATVEQLEALLTDLDGERRVLKAQKRAVVAVLERKRAEAAAVDKVAVMSPAERAAVAQVIAKAGAVPSAEAVGTPGGGGA
jgi:hypothetical protein